MHNLPIRSCKLKCTQFQVMRSVNDSGVGGECSGWGWGWWWPGVEVGEGWYSIMHKACLIVKSRSLEGTISRVKMFESA